MAKRIKGIIRAEDLYRLELIAGCEIAPDGERVVYSLQRIDKKKQKKYANLWMVPTKGGQEKQFTYGEQVDRQPRWSPNGKEIAFLSNRGYEKQTQIYIIAVDGGEARQLTQMKGDWGKLVWSPDGKKLLCQFRKKDKEILEREKDEAKKKLGVVARHIKRVFYKEDGQGYLPHERWHLWVIDGRTGKGKQLTDSKVYDEWEPQWSPDGKSIVFCSNRSSEPDLDPEAIDLYMISAQGGRMRKIETEEGPKGLPSISADGKWIAYFGVAGKSQMWKNTNLWVVPVGGKGKVKNLTQKFDFDISTMTVNDMSGIVGQSPPAWAEDGNRIYFQVSRQGSTTLHSVGIKGDRRSLQTVIGEKGVAGDFSFDRKQKRMAYFFADMKEPGQVWVRDMETGEEGQLTQVNKNILGKCDLGKVEEVWIKWGAGNDLQGWILKPPGFKAGKKYPSILEIHGGPLCQYGWFFMHEFYFLAGQGYVVHFCNPRGGQGYGEKHAKAIYNDWGGADYEDVMAWTDYVAKQRYIDRKRMGVTGGSYGGFMTNWIIGHTQRFKAAVTQRSVSNLISMYGSCDFNWAIQHYFKNEPPWENPENYWRQSPMKYIGKVQTPTLVIHSEMDMRCDIEQGEQVFVALKKLGVETEMVRFPDEPHGMSRSGRADRRIERLKHILRWFDKYLKNS